MSSENSEIIVDQTRKWVERAVIGLDLCPFAERVHRRDKIRFAVSAAPDVASLEADLHRELLLLRDADPATLETTLLIHPWVLEDFLDFNDFLAVAEQTVADLDLEGVIQVASFHPNYQFAETDASDIGNYTNRSPYPTLHLLRESSIEQALEHVANPADIYRRNIERLRRLGLRGWKSLWD